MTAGAPVAFFGTPPAAVPTLAALAAAASVSFVVTQPDRPRGRSGRPQSPAVKQAAADWGFEVLQPEKAADVSDRLLGTALAVVVAYGQILPESMLGIPEHGFVNVHFSHLPRWRGAAPVERAIEAGDVQTGVTVIQLDAGMDTGDVVAERTVGIPDGATGGSLTARLAGEGADLLKTCLAGLLEGRAEPSPQPGKGVTIAKKVSVADARLRTDVPAARLERMVRAFHPDPGAWGEVGGVRLKVLQAALQAPPMSLAQGEMAVAEDGVLVGTVEGVLRLIAVQPAGKRPMPAVDWARGQRTEVSWG